MQFDKPDRDGETEQEMECEDRSPRFQKRH